MVDQIGPNVLMSYSGTPAELCFIFNGQCLDQGGGSLVAYGPLIYREQQGWDTRVYVQNLSSIVAAKVKVETQSSAMAASFNEVPMPASRSAPGFMLSLAGDSASIFRCGCGRETQSFQ